MKKKVLIATGGTGGHIYPAVAFAEELAEKADGVSIHFIGGKLDSNAYFEKTKHPFTAIACGNLTKNPFKMASASAKILKGVAQSVRFIKHYCPDLVVGFGSYYTFPALIGAKLAQKPIMLHEANSIPGRVNRLLSSFVSMTAINFPQASHHLFGNVAAVKMPLRKDLCNSLATKNEAKNYYGLIDDLPTILVFGGSQGAKSLNELFIRSAEIKQARTPFQVVHLAGKGTDLTVLRERYQKANISACVKEFESRMDMAWRIADLSIARAGASTVAEQILFEVPSIFIPYPFATNNHQDFNAQFMERLGGAIVKRESELKPESLLLTILDGLQKLSHMQSQIKQYKSSIKLQSLADLCAHFLQG